MARLEEFDDVQLDVEFTQADTRSNLTSNENIAISFGKISKWYEALVPTGGSSGQFLAWNSSGTAKWVANPNVDTKVTSTLLAQSTAAATYLPTFVSAAGNSGVNIMNSFSFRHTVGTTSAVGNSRIVLGNATASGTANNEEGQMILYSSGTSYHTLKGDATASAVTHMLPTTGGTVLNTGTTSFTQTLTSGTKIGSIKINGTSTDIYAPTNTNTTYTLTQDATDGHKITLTPSSGTAQTVTIPDNNTTYTLSGAYGSSSNTWVTTLTPSSGTATTSTVPTASTSVYGITKLSSATNSTSTALAATPSAVKSAYDLANGKSTVSFSASLTTGTKVGTITINGTATDIYCETNTNTDTKVTNTVGTANTYYPAGGTSTSTATGTQVFDTSLKFIGTTGTTSAVGKAQLVLGNSTASGTANNKQGSIVVYGSTAYAHTIQGAPTAARTLTLPDKAGTFALTSDIPSVPTVNDAALTLKGAGTTVTTFTANASSAKSLDIVAGSNVTVTADATNAKISIASSHPTITTSTDTTSTASPAHGGTFTTVDSVTRDGNGHVTKINTKTVTLPADSNTDTKVTQTNTTTSADYRVLLSGNANDTTETTTGRKSTNLKFNPSSGGLYSFGFRWTDITGSTLDINTLTLSDGTLHSRRFIEKTDTGAEGITNIPVAGKPFLLEVDLIRWASTTDYITRQRFTNAANGTYSYVRYCTNGTWGSWTTRKYTDTNTKVTSSANHYAPATASGEDKSASATGATSAWGIDVVKGVTLNTDGKGHVTGISVTSGKIPANPVPSNNVTGSGTSGYLVKWNGANTITNGPQLGSSTTTYLRNDGTWATPTNTTYSAGTGLSLSGTTFNHSNSVTAVTSAVFKKITYDAQGHITGTANVVAADIPSLDYSKVSISRNLTSGTKVGTITIDGTATDLYCQTNTNTTYTIAAGDSNGQIKVTPSSGSAYNVSVKGLGSAAYTASTSYVQTHTGVNFNVAKSGYFAVMANENSDNPNSLLPTQNQWWHILSMSWNTYDSTDNTDVKYWVSQLAIPTYENKSIGLKWRTNSAGGSALTRDDWVTVLDEKNYTSYTYNATASRTANTVLAAPNGSDGTASFRKLVAADLPSHTHSDYVLKTGDAMSGNLSIQKSSEGTYYYAERTDTGVKVGFGVSSSNGINHGIYSNKLGAWMICGDATNVSVRAINYNPSTEASLYALPLFGGTPSTGLHALYNNNGFRYSTLQGTTLEVGIARLVLGNGTASGTAANKQGSIRLYSESSNCIDLVPASTSYAKTITIPAVTATMAVSRKSLIYDESGDFTSYPWHKFAEVTITSANYDYVTTFLVSSGTITNVSRVSKQIGMLTMHVSTGSTKIFNIGEFEWLYAGEDIDPAKFVMTYTNTANTSCKVELWCNADDTDQGYIFNIVEEHTRTDKEIYTMTLYDQNGRGDATLPSVTGTIPSTLGRIKNAPGIYPVKGTQTTSTSAWTGSIDVSELYAGLTIAYYLPYASTSTAVTLNLTLADGTTTGAIPCYETSSTALTTHYGIGSTIILTYWPTSTTGLSNRWTRCDYSTTSANQTNTTTNAIYRVLFSTNANDTTQSGTTRKNMNLVYNPSTAALGIGVYASGSTASKTGKLVLGNSSNIYTHTINTDTFKTRSIAVTLNDADGIMGTDVLCYTGYEGMTTDDTTMGSYGTISNLSNSVSFSGYLARFSYFTVLLCVGTDVSARSTVQVSSVNGYQSYQLIWGSAPAQGGGNLSITSGLVNITESSGTITMSFGKCASYWQFSSSTTPTKGTTPDIHVLKVYGHCIRSNGYH